MARKLVSGFELAARTGGHGTEAEGSAKVAVQAAYEWIKDASGVEGLACLEGLSGAELGFSEGKEEERVLGGDRRSFFWARVNAS